ncbi:MAG TPA: Rrf2 family transcriptional regulator [Dehalococcoidia bacterium]|nr:Rrf2 family transcriptional regulator [Dehalococcoidia bacterium]HLB29613.1 Rrf2 family transcriptional regulator [Dehalococcoidia bacterium]
MRFSRQADYAVKVMLELAASRQATIREVARRQQISAPYVGRIAQLLARAGLVGSRRGRRGNLFLIKPLHDITILNIVEAVDGSIPVHRCLLAPGECGREQACPVYPLGQEIMAYVVTKLGSINLASMMDGLRAGPFSIAEAETAESGSQRREARVHGSVAPSPPP